MGCELGEIRGIRFWWPDGGQRGHALFLSLLRARPICLDGRVCHGFRDLLEENAP